MFILKEDQRGIVSITVTVVLMLVISLTVIGFGQVVRREQRQALDRQQSNQAFYAAESGINDAKKYIKDHYGSVVPPNKNKCDNSEGTYNLPMVVDAASNTSYTCVLIGGTPKTLRYQLATTDPGKAFPIDAGSNTINSVNFSWTPVQPTAAPLNNCPATVPALIPTTSLSSYRCAGYGVLRVDLVPYPAGGQSRNGMMANSFTAFLWPTTTGSGQVGYNTVDGSNIFGGTANQGARPAATCTAIKCSLTVTGLNGSRYYARVSTLYRDSMLEVTAFNGGGGSLLLYGAQIMIDSTGKSEDVLRRVQVRIPLHSEGEVADNAIQTTDSLCKVITAYQGYPAGTGC